MANGTPDTAVWRRLLPGVGVLLSYERAWLKGDIVAGITVAAYLVPQVMAYSYVAGLPPVTGLWASLAPLLVYALVGPSRQLSVGPESTTALMSAAAVGALVAGAPVERRLEVSALLALAVGLVCFVGWIARLGFLARLLSRPVLVGYMAGIATLMIVSQLGKVTGMNLAGSQPWQEIGDLASRLDEVAIPVVTMALAVLVFLFLIRRWAPNWPGPLLAIVAATVAVLLGGLKARGFEVVGEIPRGLPSLGLPHLGELKWWVLGPTAIGIAVVGYSDNVLTGRAFAVKRREALDPNQEFLALGLANLGSGLTGGFPVSSSGSRTVLGDAMGSRTQVYSLVALLGVLGTLFFLAPALENFPTAALGAIVIYAAIRLVDVGEWRRIARFRRSELILAVVTALAVVTLGVLAGIGVAIVLSLLDLLRRLAKPHDGILGYVPGLAGMHDIDDYPEAEQVPGLVVYRYDSPLFFANADNFSRRALAAVDDAPSPVNWFLLNAEANVEVDLTAVDELDLLRQALSARGIVFAMARVKTDLKDQLQASGFLEKLGDEHVFPTLPTAVAGYRAWYEAQHGRPIVRPINPPPPPAP